MVSAGTPKLSPSSSRPEAPDSSGSVSDVPGLVLKPLLDQLKRRKTQHICMLNGGYRYLTLHLSYLLRIVGPMARKSVSGLSP